MSQDTVIVDESKPEEAVKRLSPAHRLVVDNMLLKLALNDEKLAGLKKDNDLLKSQLEGFINTIKSEYFSGPGNLSLDLKAGTISMVSEKIPENSPKPE